MKDDADRELAAAFAALRREEAEECPPFAGLVARGRARSRPGPSVLRFRLAGAAVLAVLLVTRPVAHPPRPSPSGAGAPSLLEWRSPTAFLLETSGREVLAAPAGWGRSVLDLDQDLPSLERRRPS